MPNERYTIGPRLLSDVRESIRVTKSLAPSTSGPHQEPRLQELQHRFRLAEGTYNGTSWAIGETAAITIAGETNTIAVQNFAFPLSSCTTTIAVTYAPKLGTMVATMINLTHLPGYDLAGATATTTVQLLGDRGGCLTWFPTTTCGTTA